MVSSRPWLRFALLSEFSSNRVRRSLDGEVRLLECREGGRFAEDFLTGIITLAFYLQWTQGPQSNEPTYGGLFGFGRGLERGSQQEARAETPLVLG